MEDTKQPPRCIQTWKIATMIIPMTQKRQTRTYFTSGTPSRNPSLFNTLQSSCTVRSHTFTMTGHLILTDFAEMIHEGDIDLDPEYQRGRCSTLFNLVCCSVVDSAAPLAVVWSSTKQMAIIDSLFHNYYVPPVVFAIAKDPIDGVETRLCVDGKQRLTSIQKFFDGQVRHPSYSFLCLSSLTVSPRFSDSL